MKTTTTLQHIREKLSHFAYLCDKNIPNWQMRKLLNTRNWRTLDDTIKQFKMPGFREFLFGLERDCICFNTAQLPVSHFLFHHFRFLTHFNI